MVGDIRLLTSKVAGQVLGLDRLGSEPEVLLLEKEAPDEKLVVSLYSRWNIVVELPLQEPRCRKAPNSCEW